MREHTDGPRVRVRVGDESTMLVSIRELHLIQSMREDAQVIAREAPGDSLDARERYLKQAVREYRDSVIDLGSSTARERYARCLRSQVRRLWQH